MSKLEITSFYYFTSCILCFIVALFVVLISRHSSSQPTDARLYFFRDNFLLWTCRFFVFFIVLAMLIIAIYEPLFGSYSNNIINWVIDPGNKSLIHVVLIPFFFSILYMIFTTMLFSSLFRGANRPSFAWIAALLISTYGSAAVSWGISVEPGGALASLPNSRQAQPATATLPPTLTATTQDEPSSPLRNPGPDATITRLTAVLILLVPTLTLAAWTVLVLLERFTKIDGFRRQSVLAFATFFWARSPAQAMIIGPKHSAKTDLVASFDDRYRARLSKRRAMLAENDATKPVGTGTIDYASLSMDNLSVTVLDMPGENLGDHCSLPFSMRTDVLVLMIRDCIFDPSMINGNQRRDFRSIPDVLSRIRALSDSDPKFVTSYVRTARDYLSALDLALNVDVKHKAGISSSLETITFGVGAFVLLVLQEHDESSERTVSKYAFAEDPAPLKNFFDPLSKDIGRRFDVKDTRCFSVYSQRGDTDLRVAIEDALRTIASGSTADTKDARAALDKEPSPAQNSVLPWFSRFSSKKPPPKGAES